jgi:hypothetical protein
MNIGLGTNNISPLFRAVLTCVAVEPATLGRFQVFVRSVFLKRPAPKFIRLRYNELNVRFKLAKHQVK